MIRSGSTRRLITIVIRSGSARRLITIVIRSGSTSRLITIVIRSGSASRLLVTTFSIPAIKHHDLSISECVGIIRSSSLSSHLKMAVSFRRIPDRNYSNFYHDFAMILRNLTVIPRCNMPIFKARCRDFDPQNAVKKIITLV